MIKTFVKDNNYIIHFCSLIIPIYTCMRSKLKTQYSVSKHKNVDLYKLCMMSVSYHEIVFISQREYNIIYSIKCDPLETYEHHQQTNMCNQCGIPNFFPLQLCSIQNT